MSLLIDREINDLLSRNPSLASNVSQDEFLQAGSKIQAASLTMTIGAIFIPGPPGKRSGGALDPLKEFTLRQGHTAVIRTEEVLDMGPRLAGIAFPPSSLSLKGLLMTNPGHIDPGYKGALHITVINMSRTPFGLRVGDRIMRVLFMPLDADPSAPYDQRHSNEDTPDIITSELLDKLSVDFVDVEKRAKKIANKAVRKAAALATVIPAIIAAVALFANAYVGLDPIKEALSKIDARLSVAESRQAGTLEERIHKIEEKLASSSASLKK